MKNTATESKVALIKAEINKELGDAETLKALIDTTFTSKGKPMEAQLVKRALLEGMLRGFSFQDFLNRNVYAIPFADTYSLITSIDYARKIGAKNGVVGVDAPIYQENDNGVVSCAVTVHKKIGDYVGAFTAEVFFSEYSTGQNLWKSKPRHMIAKVAEAHALRKACPDELSQAYVEEELQRRDPVKATAIDLEELADAEKLLLSCKDLESLNNYFADLPGEFKLKLKVHYDAQKAIIEQESKDSAD